MKKSLIPYYQIYKNFEKPKFVQPPPPAPVEVK